MSRDESIRLVAMQIAALGHANLSASESQGNAWAALMPEISYEDAVAALMAHLRESRFPATPADIIERVRVMRAQRHAAWERTIGEAGHAPVPPVSADDTVAYVRWLREFHNGIGDGLSAADADARACRILGVERLVLEERPRNFPLARLGKRVPKR